MVPDSDFVLTELKLCGTTYEIGQQFLSQSELLTFLNDTFNSIYEYSGVWTIVAYHLIYTGPEECPGDNCLSVITQYRVTEDFQPRLTDNNNIRII